MDRGKEIAELKDILKKAIGTWHIVADETTSIYEYVAEKIIDAGYESTDDKMIIPLKEFCREFREAQEYARKETAKEILDKLLTVMTHGYEQVKAFVEVKEEEYGIKVDE